MAIKKRVLSLLIAMALIVLSFGCDSGQKAATEVDESLLDTIVKRGTLRVGMSTFLPWAMQDKNGEFIGFEIDVARQLASDMGVKVEFVPTKWAGIIPALLTSKFDIIIGGMGIRPDRNLKVNFTIPYDHSGMSMVAHKVNAAGFNKLEDFNNENVIISTRIGTTAADAAKKYLPKAQLKLFDDEAQARQELMTGRAHALVASAPLPAFHAIKYADKLFLPFTGTFTKEPIGFAVRKGDHDFMNYLNNWILIQHADGFLADKKHYWFETKEWESNIQ